VNEATAWNRHEVNFARPLFKEALEIGEHHCYWLAGSCFLAGLGERLFILTAGHVAKGGEVDDVRVQVAPSAREFLPLKSGCSAIALDKFDPDYGDLSAFEVEVALLSPQQIGTTSFLRISDNDRQGVGSAPPGTKLTIKGYPWELNSIDYETDSIQIRALLASGNLRGNAPMQGCYTLELDDPSIVENLQLMSGSAIMTMPDDAAIHAMPQLAGMAIRGGSGQIHFVDSSRICLFLEKICSN
jgi:hypothetical protein